MQINFKETIEGIKVIGTVVIPWTKTGSTAFDHEFGTEDPGPELLDFDVEDIEIEELDLGQWNKDGRYDNIEDPDLIDLEDLEQVLKNSDKVETSIMAYEH